jgi:hypothetical protein
MVDTNALDKGKATVWNGKKSVTRSSGIDNASLALLALDHTNLFISVASTLPHYISEYKGHRPSKPRQFMDYGHQFNKNNAFGG